MPSSTKPLLLSVVVFHLTGKFLDLLNLGCTFKELFNTKGERWKSWKSYNAFQKLQSTRLGLAIKSIQRHEESVGIPKWSPVNLWQQQWGSCAVVTVYLCHIKCMSALLAAHILSYKCCSKPFSHKISELNKILTSQRKELGEILKSHLVLSQDQTNCTYLSFQIDRWPAVVHRWPEITNQKILDKHVALRHTGAWRMPPTLLKNVNHGWIFC